MAANARVPSIANGFDRYVVIHMSTTCDEHGVYVTKDSAEIIELGWILLDASSYDEIIRDSVLVKPVNTPITPLCTSLTTLTWEHIKNVGSFRDAIILLDQFIQEHILANDLTFVFVCFDSWDLRVQLPREARDKAVGLPPYLLHPCTFDLRTEFQHWRQYHPESSNFNATTLSNICAVLDVEPVQCNASIKHSLPFHLQALAPSSPRRALDEAITIARALRGLIQKSQPLHLHPDILTRPHDALVDMQAFLTERSKVLHLSGLSHDTTQSELESWFTQFGGRPIAFWTLRTPDQHKPTGTGFAVFSSHKEAAESLSMNGRALNDKAVEVSPSSSRVLDRAAEILTPFPSSKNRPRPGDWTCPSCGFSNFQRRSQCFRCSFNPLNTLPGGHNDNLNYLSGNCVYPHSIMGPGHGHANVHTGIQGNLVGRGGHCGSIVPFRAGDWKCGTNGCNYHNFAKNISCLRCGASRATANIINNGGFAPTLANTNTMNVYGMNSQMGNPINTPHNSFAGTQGGYDSISGFVDQFTPVNNYGISGSIGTGATYSCMSTPTFPSLNAPGFGSIGSGYESRHDPVYTSCINSSSSNNASLQSNGGSGSGVCPSNGSAGPISSGFLKNATTYSLMNDSFFLTSGLDSLCLNEGGRNAASVSTKSVA